MPPRFFTIALTDRDTGEVWALLNEPTSEHIKIVSPPPSGFRGHTFEAFGGPRLLIQEGETVQLLIRGGNLGYEIADNIVRQRPVFAPDQVRAKPSATFFEVTLPDGFDPRTGVLAYETEVTF